MIDLSKEKKALEELSLLFQCKNQLREIKEEYNSVLGSKKDIYQVKQNNIVMSFQKTFEKTPETLVRSLLRPKERKRLERLIDQGNFPLVAIVKKDDNDSFCGYYPLSAGIDSEKLTVHRTKEGLDVLENFCGGG